LSQTLAWPASEPLADSLPLAYATLFRLWGRDYRAGLDARQQAGAFGLRCYGARGSLDELRRLNRPAVLRMRGAQGEEFHATLTALAENSATFAIGAERTRIPLAALAAQWSGHFLLLWRAPAQVPGDLIRAGDRGPAAQWLAGELARANGRPAGADSKAVFDEALAREVKAFQLAQGLVPDGAVGPQTLMRLAGHGDRAAPTLTPRQTK
jgi:general secretion pathway protein A